MNRILCRWLVFGVIVLVFSVRLQYGRISGLKAERDRQEQNSMALLTEMKRMQVDSVTMALDVEGLRLSVDEYKRFRAADAEKMKKMGIRLRDLEAVARHELVVDAPLDASVRDTLVVRDSSLYAIERVEMVSPYIELSGIIEGQRLKGYIRVPITLRQAVWIEYRRRWIFWRKVKAVHQVIATDNPYAEVTYSEYISLEK